MNFLLLALALLLVLLALFVIYAVVDAEARSDDRDSDFYLVCEAKTPAFMSGMKRA